MRIRILTGQTFTRLLVLGRSPRKSKSVYWDCLCSCGTCKAVNASALVNGLTKSCGCLQRETKGALKHGGFGTPEYGSYLGAKRRCTNPNDAAFANYGGRGIEFRFEGFEQFLATVGVRPSKTHSLDRIDVNGHYEPGNVRWATRSEQNNNKRVHVLLTLHGRTQNANQWAKELGMPRQMILHRRKKGWSDAEALTAPTKVVRLTLNGITKPLVEWASELGVKARTLNARRHRGWSDEEILTRPVKSIRAYKIKDADLFYIGDRRGGGR